MNLALGTAQFGMQYGVANNSGQPSEAEIKEILQIAGANGINALDTAIAYGDCEERLGRIGVPNWQIISKFPPTASNDANIYEQVRVAVVGSLQKLGVERLYALLLHRPEQLLKKNGDHLYLALERVKQEGLIGKIGISIYDPNILEILLSNFNFDLVQAPFNPFDRRLISSGWASRLKSLGIELHIRSVFLQGLLLMQEGQRPSQFDQWSTVWCRWHEWIREMRISALEACLGFVASFDEFDRILVGVDNKKQLLQIIGGMKKPAIAVPDEFCSNDLCLINPANWVYLNGNKT
jgi:aryl-alcohol dehydrogenase-like predicted oxidoreductase